MAALLNVIRAECRFCMNSEILRECNSTACKLNDLSFTSNLKRIKAHCISCVPEQSIQGVKKCTGKLLNGICSLHPYRIGHNYRRKGIGNLNARGNPEALKRYRELKLSG